MRWMSPSPGTPFGASLNSRKVRTELGLASSSPKYVWYTNVVSKLSVFLTNRSPMTRHQKSTLVTTSRVTPVKWCGPLSGCFMRSPPRLWPEKICTIDITRQYLRPHDLDRSAHDRRPGGRAPEDRDPGRRAAGRGEAAPGRDRAELRGQHHAGARGPGHAAAPGARPAPSAAWRRRLPAERGRPAPPLRDPGRARGAGRGQDRRALRAGVGAPAVGAAGPDARRRAGGHVHRAQPALPHDALRALRARPARGDDRRAA